MTINDQHHPVLPFLRVLFKTNFSTKDNTFKAIRTYLYDFYIKNKLRKQQSFQTLELSSK